MAITNALPAIKSVFATVDLIPWDPDSPEHVERMVEQRIACGWKQEAPRSWKPLQDEGKMALQWVVLSDTDAEKGDKLRKHLAAFPRESEPLVDSATSLGGKPRTPESRKKFIPVGHISLNTEYEKDGYVDPVPGLYFIATFYISDALQGVGLGRAAMDAVEHTAISEPLNAKTLALSTVMRDYEGKAEKWAALGREPPKISNQDWYERRGYKVFKVVDNMWSEADATGKVWWVPAVFMRKDIT